MPFRLPEERLFNPDPTAYLPHRYPFLFLDRITAREPGVAAAAIRRVSADDHCFTSFLMVEGLAQLAGVATVQEEGEGGFLATIDHAEFLAPFCPGDTLAFSVRVVKSFGRLFMIDGEVSSGGTILTRASLTLGVGKL
ncbi:3-hydroxyacyl-[acyl-carrier-protein] dehydratase FabZ [Geobacter sp. OR-1]|uniref:hotdog domain-containing protein n=1 Tax=Geobacter sp. OR-1 TaxID=1266765 RepID=UPI0005427705|nr:hotdog domain-containing protein [Geobacter sp. OR-1]GAM08858.1 3-hydroxyacyl-[acyl-carrier-protein] dehydratase FabZ [Geobacter sp. OR-1]